MDNFHSYITFVKSNKIIIIFNNMKILINNNENINRCMPVQILAVGILEMPAGIRLNYIILEALFQFMEKV